MTCFEVNITLLEVILYEFWSLGLKRPCSFRACPLAALTLSGEHARTGFLEDERPHGERSPAGSQHQLPAM